MTQPTTPYDMDCGFGGATVKGDHFGTLRLEARQRREGYLRALADLAPQLAAKFEEGIRSVVGIRCLAHRDVPFFNRSEMSGGECGACVAEAKDATIKALVEALGHVQEFAQKWPFTGLSDAKTYMGYEHLMRDVRTAIALAQKEHGNG